MVTKISAAAVGSATLLALTIAPATALTVSQFSTAFTPHAERIWWDGSGRWRPDVAASGFRPAQPHYHCWRPLHGPLRCQWDY